MRDILGGEARELSWRSWSVNKPTAAAHRILWADESKEHVSACVIFATNKQPTTALQRGSTIYRCVYFGAFLFFVPIIYLIDDEI